MRLVVVGAHLAGLPLNHQLIERGAVLERSCSTSPSYRLHLLPTGRPPRPGLVRVADGGAPIAVEVWLLPKRHLASFLCAIDPPLTIGTVALNDGTQEKGFLCEHYAAVVGEDITRFGGWRAYLEAR
jgi:allophanate hydrolase